MHQKYICNDAHCSIVPNTIKTKPINRKNIKINYGYNLTLDPGTDSKEKEAGPCAFPWEHLQDKQFDKKQEKDLKDTHGIVRVSTCGEWDCGGRQRRG